LCGERSFYENRSESHIKKGLPEQLRLLSETDQHFQVLYGLRNDSESINSGYKRTLITDRAATRGWRRQALDLLSCGLVSNSFALLHSE
jgi:hypothetical protein